MTMKTVHPHNHEHDSGGAFPVAEVAFQNAYAGSELAGVGKTLKALPGVQRAGVDLASGAAAVRHDENTDAARLIEAVAEAGYQAHRAWGAEK